MLLDLILSTFYLHTSIYDHNVYSLAFHLLVVAKDTFLVKQKSKYVFGQRVLNCLVLSGLVHHGLLRSPWVHLVIVLLNRLDPPDNIPNRYSDCPTGQISGAPESPC